MNKNNDKINIRPFHFSDLPSIYRICLLTAKSGKDASDIYKDHDLVGHFSAGPYAFFEPELTLILTLDNKPSGYILGTKNSEEFSTKCEAEWFPTLREQYTLPDASDQSNDANIIRRIHNGYIFKEEFHNYPAHLHIDLLPVTQGKGLGRKMIETFIQKLKNGNVSGLHLEVGKKNIGAIEFYKKIGFHQIVEYDYSIAFGMTLTD